MSAIEAMLKEPDLVVDESDYGVEINEVGEDQAVGEYSMLFQLGQHDDDSCRVLEGLESDLAMASGPLILSIPNFSSEHWPRDLAGQLFGEYEMPQERDNLGQDLYFMIHPDEVSSTDDENEVDDVMESSSEEESDEEDSDEDSLQQSDEEDESDSDPGFIPTMLQFQIPDLFEDDLSSEEVEQANENEEKFWFMIEGYLEHNNKKKKNRPQLGLAYRNL